MNNSTIGEWNDSLYERTLRRIQEASKHGVVKGILWHQGESDCGDASSSKYRDMLSRTLNRFRRDLRNPDLPLMVGQMGQFTRWHDGQNRVNEAQEIVCKTTPSCRFVSSTGLPSRGDRLHFSTNGAREFRIRYVLGYVNLLKHPKDDGLKVQTSVAPMKEKEPEKASVSSTPSSSPPLEDKMHIYILAGASNMVGRDKPMSGDQFNQTP